MTEETPQPSTSADQMDASGDSGGTVSDESPAAGDPLTHRRDAQAPDDAEPDDFAVTEDAAFFQSGAIGTGNIRSKGSQIVIGDGAMAADSIHLTTVKTRRERRSWSALFGREFNDELAAVYTDGPSDQELRSALALRSVVYLSGESGRGRHSAARMALVRRHASDRVVLITVAAGARLTDAIEPDTFREAHGHVVDATAGRFVDRMDLMTLEERAVQRQSTVIVIAGQGQPGPDLGHYLIAHRPAAPAAVLRNHLTYLLEQRGQCIGNCAECRNGCVTEFVRRCLEHPMLSSYLSDTAATREIAEVAAALAAQPAGGDLDDVLADMLPDRLRAQAQEILWADDDECRDDDRRPSGTAEYRRAFRIAYAAFDGAPMASVFDATDRLLRTNGDEAIDGLGGQTQFGIAMECLLPDRMRKGEEARPSVGVPRVARLANRELAWAVLDVAWNSWGLAGRLLRWLADMADDRQPTVRQRAAVIAGRLAYYDFGSVMGNLIEPWVHSSRLRLRQVAALGLVQIAADKDLHQQLRQCLRRWADSEKVYAHDTVARAYALGIGQLLPYEGLDHLRVAARDPWQRGSFLVAIGVHHSYDAGRAAAVVNELIEWAGSDEERLQLHAGRAFLLLARRSAVEPEPLWPELLRRLHGGELTVDQVALLWVLALSYPRTAGSAWSVLTYWFRRAEQNPQIAGLLLEVIRSLAGIRPIRSRLDHQLRHVWREQRPASELLSAVATIIEED